MSLIILYYCLDMNMNTTSMITNIIIIVRIIIIIIKIKEIHRKLGK